MTADLPMPRMTREVSMAEHYLLLLADAGERHQWHIQLLPTGWGGWSLTVSQQGGHVASFGDQDREVVFKHVLEQVRAKGYQL